MRRAARSWRGASPADPAVRAQLKNVSVVRRPQVAPGRPVIDVLRERHGFREVEEMSGHDYAERNGARGTIVFDGYYGQLAGSADQAQRFKYRVLPARGAPVPSGRGA